MSTPARERRGRRVLVAGGGVAGLEALIALRALAEERVALTILTPNEEFSYPALSVARPFDPARAERFPLGPILAAQGAEHVRDELAGVDLACRRARTRAGDELAFDELLVAVGARPSAWLEGALTIGLPGSAGELSALLEDIRAGSVRRVAFVAPAWSGWSLPIYELALLTATWARSALVEALDLVVVTGEQRPLAAFGKAAAEAIAGLLAKRGIVLRTGSHPDAFEDGRLFMPLEGSFAVDRVVTVPRQHGPELPGLPADAHGFLRIDEHARVPGAENVHAAGDCTTHPVKQGGLAAQQAEAAARDIAHRAGAPVAADPWRSALRALLLTGGAPLYLRVGADGESETGEAPLWWPPSKVPGRYLSSCLAGIEIDEELRRSDGAASTHESPQGPASEPAPDPGPDPPPAPA